MKQLFFLLLVLFSTACGSGSSSSANTCPYGSPVAIFDEKIPGIVTHQFSVEGQNANESVQFDNGMALSILQSGCEHIHQEFRFTIPGKAPEDGDAFWMAQAAQQFHFLGQLSERHHQYHQYAKAIETIAPEAKLAQEVALGDGFSIKTDRISGPDYTLLQVTLKQ